MIRLEQACWSHKGGHACFTQRRLARARGQGDYDTGFSPSPASLVPGPTFALVLGNKFHVSVCCQVQSVPSALLPTGVTLPHVQPKPPCSSREVRCLQGGQTAFYPRSLGLAPLQPDGTETMARPRSVRRQALIHHLPLLLGPCFLKPEPPGSCHPLPSHVPTSSSAAAGIAGNIAKKTS